MMYLKDKFTVDMGKVNPEMCCEGCVFGTGYHEGWCPVLKAAIPHWTEYLADSKKISEACNQKIGTKTSDVASEGA